MSHATLEKTEVGTYIFQIYDGSSEAPVDTWEVDMFRDMCLMDTVDKVIGNKTVAYIDAADNKILLRFQAPGKERYTWAVDKLLIAETGGEYQC